MHLSFFIGGKNGVKALGTGPRKAGPRPTEAEVISVVGKAINAKEE